MFSYSTLTLSIALVAAIASAVDIPVEFNLNMNFEGSFDVACSLEVFQDINMLALEAIDFIMDEYKDEIGGTVTINQIIEESESLSNPIASDPSGRELSSMLSQYAKLIARLKASGSVRIDGTCRGCIKAVDIFNDAIRRRRSLRGGSSLSLMEAIELELKGLLGFGLSGDHYKHDCLKGATGLSVELTAADVENE